MPLPLTVSCFSKIQIGFIFLVPAHPGSPGKGAVKRVCVCVVSLNYFVNILMLRNFYVMLRYTVPVLYIKFSFGSCIGRNIYPHLYPRTLVL